jgi:hypothetical protein
MQQVRAEVQAGSVASFEYLFERERTEWDPEFSTDEQVRPSNEIIDEVALAEARGGDRSTREWKLVRGLVPRLGSAKERDEAALKLAAPDSGSFILVSLRRRRKDRIGQLERES